MRLSILLLLLVPIAACAATVRAPEVELRTAPVKVQVGGGGFCPPGQAKKGVC
jgi:hypothetical protein